MKIEINHAFFAVNKKKKAEESDEDDIATPEEGINGDIGEKCNF